MADQKILAAFWEAILRQLYKRRPAPPTPAEVSTWRVGEALVRTDTVLPEWWMKLRDGPVLQRIYPQAGTAPGTIYVPSVPADWNPPVPTNVAEALDQIAARVRAIEAGGLPAVLVEDWTCLNPAVVPGDAMYVSGVDTVDWADATGEATAPAIGFALAWVGPVTLRVKYQGAITPTKIGPPGPLVAGKSYYIDPSTPGGIIEQQPAPWPPWPQGSVVQPVGFARNATELVISIDRFYTVL
jgi:hypothetical protein